jgi:hypothetical protein
MKFLLQFLITIVICFILQTFLPWWSMAIGCVTIGYVFSNGSLRSFVIGFLGIGLLWVGLALWIDLQTQSILTEKMNRLLPINSVVLTGLVGALVGGFASMTGALAASKSTRR